MSKNEPLATAKTGCHHIDGAAFPHLVLAFQVSSFDSLVANETLLSLQRSLQVTLLQRAGGGGGGGGGGVSVHPRPPVQISTLYLHQGGRKEGRKDSELREVVGDQRVEQEDP